MRPNEHADTVFLLLKQVCCWNDKRLGSSQMSGPRNQQTLRMPVQTSSVMLERLNSNFRPQLLQYQVSSFDEQRPMKQFPTKVRESVLSWQWCAPTYQPLADHDRKYCYTNNSSHLLFIVYRRQYLTKIGLVAQAISTL